MIMGSIARRYAKALFSLAVEMRRVEPWSESLQSLNEAIEGSPDLRDVLSNPVYSREQRRAIVEKLAAALRLDSEPANLLFLLGDRNRLGYLRRDRGHLPRARRRRTSAASARKVTSAVPLDAAAAQAIADRLSQATQGDRPARPRGRSRHRSAAWSRRSAASSTTARSAPSSKICGAS